MGLASCKQRESSRRVGALITGAVLVLVLAAPATAAGESTPGVTVTALNPAGSRTGSDLALALTAHSEQTALAVASCRPQDATIDCWGSLVLRIPKFGDLAVGDFEVHRIAVGDIAVGDIACDDEGDEGGGCEHDMAVASLAEAPVLVQVNGVGTVKWSGNTGLAVGTKLQLKFTFTDNGSAPYADLVVVQVNRFVEGPSKPLLYRSDPEPIRQVEIHVVSGEG